ncbi:hypothetical protein [Butyrivibrio fibrisolvens]|uniref:4-amino-4-deoxy-L-arabinose transferase n=1 Tax=Butyrivibrio fibrisolvens TaxID=831 RepID=A0A317FWW3_BUTFI|nr:hypothetical protein [Butyrivibrio fibrisolvens]PWT26174.1 hypothetical protein CPT75_03090 [Butyrivibrio fibrisolvens]
MRKLKDFINKVLTMRNMAVVSIALMVVALLPVIMCSFHNYATGDDFYYGAAIKQALRDGKGFFGCISAMWSDIVEEYFAFQGTWSSGILFRLVPVLVSERFYTVTTWISFLMLLGCTWYFLHYVLRTKCKWNSAAFWIVISIMSICLTQWMPFPRAGLFWYTGMIHYVFPFGITMLVFTWCFKYLETDKIRYYVGIILGMTYIGGAGYPEVVLAAGGVFFVFVWMAFIEKVSKKQLWLLSIPFLLEMIGFAISAAAPGNKNRGGEDFGFSITNVFVTLGKCFKMGITGSVTYLIDTPLLWILTILVLAVSWRMFSNNTDQKVKAILKHPALFLIVSYLLVSAVYAPQMYAGDVQSGYSGGVFDSYYFTFIVVWILELVYLSGWFWLYVAPDHENIDKASIKLVLSAAILLIMAVTGKYMVKTSIDYTCYSFWTSGQLADFEEQMQERLAILQDDTITDAVVPEMNSEQGPFMHFALMRDPAVYTNSVTRRFYGKHSVIAIPRDEYNEHFGK